MPIFAPLSRPPEEASEVGVFVAVLVDVDCVVDVAGEDVVDDPVEELREVEVEVEDDDEDEVEDTPTVAASTIPSFALQQV